MRGLHTTARGLAQRKSSRSGKASERVKEFADAGDGAYSATNAVPPRPEFSGFLGHFGRVAFHRDRFQQFFHGFSVMRWVGRARRFNLFSDLGPAKTLDAEGESR
jgi:hypothetical protein